MMLLRRTLALALVLAGALALARAGEAGGAHGDLAERSLPLRTALHRDPAMAAPFERLLALYRGAGRTDELVAVYESHLARYPHDAGARTVLVRIMRATGSPDAAHAAQQACERHPDNAYLRFLNYESLRANHDPKALAELDRAIELETAPGRKREWIDVLLPEAVAVERRDLAERHLRALAELVGGAPDGRLGVARQMIKFRFFEAALDALNNRPAGEAEARSGPRRGPHDAASPEIMVETELAAAEAMAGLGRTEEAGARLERLLSKLTADYWQRPAILRRRIALVASDADRDAMIRSARESVAASPPGHPDYEAAVLDLAELLAGFERRRDALGVLLDAGKLCPASARIEKETIELLDRLRDERGREAYLARRIAAGPRRPVLVLEHARSLFLLGRRKEAASEFEGLIESLPPEERFDQILETARFLRRQNLSPDAAELFRWAVALAPSRLDVRRELAETFLALGDRTRAAELFTDLDAEGLVGAAETEHLLDVVQFMIGQELYRQARAALVRAAGPNETNLEIRTLLLTVHGRLADQEAGEELITETRPLADTPSRYRLWLESAVAFHGTFDSVEDFIEQERARLDLEAPVGPSPRRRGFGPAGGSATAPGGAGGEWSAATLERRTAFADAAARSGCSDLAAAAIDGYLAGELPPEMRVKLRRRLVSILEKEPDQADAVEAELARLAEDDPQHADEYNARLALLYSKSNRFDLANPLLEQVDVDALGDAVLLSRLEALYRQRGGGGKPMRILERLTSLDPTNRGNWERWLSALAKAGDEVRLRSGVLRLLAGVERMPIAEETQILLRSHLVDSYWRSIAELIASGAGPGLSDALVLLDSVERSTRGSAEFLWTTWSRAYVLNQLDRLEERDEAIGELERVAAEFTVEPPSAEADAEKPEAVPSQLGAFGRGCITFPDGLTVSFEGARGLLTGTPEREKPPRAARRGPIGELRVRWAFDTGAGAPVTGILPLEGARTLVCDLRGRLYCLDSFTGKLLWEREGALPSTAARAPNNNWWVSNGRTSYMDPPIPASPLVLGEGRVLVPGRGKVECLSAESGRLVWRAEVGGAAVLGMVSPGGRPFVSVFVHGGRSTSSRRPRPEPVEGHGGRVLAYDPVSCRVSALDRTTGKLVWEKELAAGGKRPVGWLNSGASLSGNRLLVYGSRTAILDADTGEVEWSFEPARVRRFPVKIKEPAGASAQTAAAATSWAGPSANVQWIQSSMWGGRSGYGRGYSAQPQYISYLGRGGSGHPRYAQAYSGRHASAGTVLAAPAVVWAAGGGTQWQPSRGQPRMGELRDGFLLLFSQNSLLVLDLDLPLKGRQIQVSGTFVGMAGRVACFLQQNALSLVDTSTGQSKAYGLQEVVGGRRNARVGACVDGPHVYVTGPGGVACVNARAALRVAHCAWPELVAGDDGLLAVPAAAVPQSIQYYLQGTVTNRNNGSGPCMPMVDRVAGGVLYATPVPSRVVVLEEALEEGAEDW